MLQENLFNAKESVVMTSATLATNRNFDYLKKRIGMNEYRELLVDSPFNFKGTGKNTYSAFYAGSK